MTMTTRFRIAMGVGAAALVMAALPASPQAPAAGAPGQPGGRGGFGRGAAPYDYADNTGFTSLFDGKTLSGWDSDTRFWSVKDSAIYVHATCEKPTGTIYAVWQGGDVSDFILKYELKGTTGINSGMQFRSYLTSDPSVSMKYPPRAARGPGGGGRRARRGCWSRSRRRTRRSGPWRLWRTRAGVRQSGHSSHRGRRSEVGHVRAAGRFRRQQQLFRDVL